MPTLNVVLTDHQATMIKAIVESGRYRNASEVLREGLKLVEQRETEDGARLEALRTAARVGDEAFERGDYTAFPSADDAVTHLRKIGRGVFERHAKR